MTWDGDSVWDGSQYGQTMAYSVQTYNKSSVLAIWSGAFNANGYGDGYGLILNDRYEMIANV
jgi:hypothetical protein